MAARTKTQATQPITIRINGEWRAFEVGRDLEPSTTLSAFLREHLGFTGLKISCDEGACGACTIIMDGKAVLSCMLLAVEADGHDLLTIEGLPYDDPVIEAFAEQCEPGHGTALQCGYCTPGFVMATRALLDENPAPTLDETKEALSGNLCRCGCYAAIAMAVGHASEKIARGQRQSRCLGERRPGMSAVHKPRVARKFIGGYRPRIDAVEKAHGRAPYADDMISERNYPGLLYAQVLRSPYPRARIVRLDASKAARLPGVVAILTYQDPEVARLKPTNAGWTDAVDTVSYDNMMWRKFRDRRVLGDYAAWAGDEVGVAIAAESELIAEQALRLVEVEWEELPFVLDPLAAMQPGAPVIHPQIAEHNVLPPDPIGGPDVFLVKGDVEAGFAEADVVIEMDTSHHNPTQGALDPWCCVAQWEDDRLTVVSNSYAADQTRMHVSQMLELPIHKVRVISKYVGGQFGRGDTGDQPFFLFTALLAKKAGRPVKFKHSRRDSFHDTRQPALYHCKVGAKADGTITAIHFKSIGDVGAHADHTVFALKFVPAELSEVVLAPIPHVKMESYAVYTNHIPGCMMRGVGNSQFNFIFGRMVDGLAERLDMDPLALAIKNFGHAWARCPTSA